MMSEDRYVAVLIARIAFFNNDGHQDLVMLGLELSNKTERRRDRERERISNPR